MRREILGEVKSPRKRKVNFLSEGTEAGTAPERRRRKMTGRGHGRRRESADAQAELDRALIDHSFRKKRKGLGSSADSAHVEGPQAESLQVRDPGVRTGVGSLATLL
ncbi:unnamed protein product [Pleuronectes platessa]|uniref:Uncharacterized protein n=1 Tax=Pleuronectes platessa TaxID=8262 RepID=A0A9N7V283_PLEPL|nr:unnamed protein product [Pleuronectes platessa]